MIGDEILKYLESESKRKFETRDGEETLTVRKEGTLFFLYFAPWCNLHQISAGVGGMTVRDQIEVALISRFIRAFLVHYNKSIPTETISNLLDINIRHKPNCKYDNGKVCFWIRDYLFKEDFIIRTLLKLKQMLDNNPIRVLLPSGERGIIIFSGWGFGYS